MPPAESLDQTVADRERREQRDLLRRDRRDEALERVRRQRRTEPFEPNDERVEHRLLGGPGSERLELELRAQQLQDNRPSLVVERLDVDASGGRLDPHLALADDAVEAALVPEVRKVDAERTEALRSVRPALVRSGGTLPIVPALADRGIPTIITGFALPDANIHSPNERLRAE